MNRTTGNAASTIDERLARVTRTITIAAPRALVFAVLTEPSEIGQWFGQSADFPDGVAEGAAGTFSWAAHGVFPARIEIYSPHERFAFTWGTPGEPLREDNSTTASFTLTDDPSGTVLTVTETGFTGDLAARRAAMADNAQGWTEELDDLAGHVLALAQTPGTGVVPSVDLEAGRIVRSVLVRAPIQHTWDILTSAEAIEQWWGHPARFPDGMSVGATGTFEWVGHGLMPMRIERFDEPVAFDLLWGDVDEEEVGPNSSRVSFALHAVDADSTLVSVCEKGFLDLDRAERRSAMDENVKGWTAVLDGLVSFAEAAADRR